MTFISSSIPKIRIPFRTLLGWLVGRPGWTDICAERMDFENRRKGCQISNNPCMPRARSCIRAAVWICRRVCVNKNVQQAERHACACASNMHLYIYTHMHAQVYGTHEDPLKPCAWLHKLDRAEPFTYAG